MVQCCVKGCNNNSRNGYKVYSLPSKIKKLYCRNQWLQNAGLNEDDLSKDPRFCEGHFTPDSFERPDFHGIVRLKSNAVPTVFGENLPKTVSVFRDVQDENILPEPRSPLANINQNYEGEGPDEPLTPVSKRRKSYSIAEEDLTEAEKLRISLNQALKERNHYKKMSSLWKERCENLSKNFKNFLNDDQIALLQKEDPSQNTTEWSEETIKTAIQIRLMVKSQGYEFLRTKLKWPLPSFRTLRRRLECLEFLPGHQEEIIRLLPAKVVDPNDPASALCALSVDEMKISEGVAYDKGLKKCLGLISPILARDEQEENTLASHVLVVSLKGLGGLSIPVCHITLGYTRGQFWNAPQ